MAYIAREARQDLLADVARATDALGAALAALGSAYEGLDEQMADMVEAQLFRPVQLAYGRARRTHAGFAERHGLESRAFSPAAAPGTSMQRPPAQLETAKESVIDADDILAELQDSLLPVEVGDAELRAGLAEVRALIAGYDKLTLAVTRRLGR